MIGFIAFAAWLLAAVSCTRLGWYIPGVKYILWVASTRKDFEDDV